MAVAAGGAALGEREDLVVVSEAEAVFADGNRGVDALVDEVGCDGGEGHGGGRLFWGGGGGAAAGGGEVVAAAEVEAEGGADFGDAGVFGVGFAGGFVEAGDLAGFELWEILGEAAEDGDAEAVVLGLGEFDAEGGDGVADEEGEFLGFGGFAGRHGGGLVGWGLEGGGRQGGCGGVEAGGVEGVLQVGCMGFAGMHDGGVVGVEDGADVFEGEVEVLAEEDHGGMTGVDDMDGTVGPEEPGEGAAEGLGDGEQDAEDVAVEVGGVEGEEVGMEECG